MAEGEDKEKKPKRRPRSTTPRRMPDVPMTPDERRAKDRERKRKKYRDGKG